MVETVGEVGEVCSARVRAVRLMDGATVRVGSCMEGICGRSVLTRFRVRWWGQWEKCAQLVCEPCARVPGVHGTNRGVIPPYRSHLQTKVLQSADKICILSFLSHLIPVSAAPLSAVCYNLYLQYGICRLALSLCSAPLCRVLQSVFAIWNLQTLSPALQLPSPPHAAICICNLRSADSPP